MYFDLPPLPGIPGGPVMPGKPSAPVRRELYFCSDYAILNTCLIIKAENYLTWLSRIAAFSWNTRRTYREEIYLYSNNDL